MMNAREGKSGVKLFFRILLVLGAPFIAYFTAALGSRFTVAALGSGRYEATPATVVWIFAVFPLTLIFILVAGNIAINRYVPPISSARNLNQKSLAFIIGFVGTLAYYVLVCVAERVVGDIGGINREGGIPELLVLMPLLPGVIPGALVGFPFGGWDGVPFFVCGLISGPIMNSYYVYLWLNWRATHQKVATTEEPN